MLTIKASFDNDTLKERVMEDLDMCEDEFDSICFTVEIITKETALPDMETITYISIEDGLLLYNINDFLEVEQK